MMTDLNAVLDLLEEGAVGFDIDDDDDFVDWSDRALEELHKHGRLTNTLTNKQYDEWRKQNIQS